MQRVAASEVWSLGKLVNITFKVLKTSSLIVAVDHNSLSSAAAKQSIGSMSKFLKEYINILKEEEEEEEEEERIRLLRL